MASEPNKEAYLQLVIQSQNRLYAYILSLTADREAAQDILQEVNLVLLRKADEFEIGTNFNSWSSTIAYYQVSSYWLKNNRNPMVFNSELMTCLAKEASEIGETFDERQDALKLCIEKLTQSKRILLKYRYQEGMHLKSISMLLDKPANTIGKELHRIRTSLMKCIENTLKQKGLG